MSVSVTPSSSLNLEDPEIQEPEKLPCCTWRSCCGSKMSWRDITVISLYVISAPSALVTGAYGGISTDADVRRVAFTVAGLFTAVFAVAVFIHFCWRKDAVVADLTKAANTLEKTKNELEETVKEADAIEKALLEENERLKKEVENLQKIPKDIKTENDKLDGEVDKLEAQVDGLKQQIADLEKQNQQLADHLDQCRNAIDTITKHVTEVNHLHVQMSANTDVLDGEVGKFSSENKVLELAIGSIDKTMDENIDVLKNALKESQDIVNQNMNAFSQEIARLQKEVEGLKSAVQAVDKYEDDVRDRVEAIQKLNREIAEKEIDLGKLQEKFKEKSEALLSVQKALEESVRVLQSTGTKFTGDVEQMQQLADLLDQLSKPLADMEKRLSQDLGSLKDMGDTLKSQRDEIDKL
ncbi:MAG: hypothetical protein ACK5MA_08780 [Parachlamydiaceae bacterium]